MHGGVVVLWLTYWTSDLKVSGSSRFQFFWKTLNSKAVILTQVYTNKNR